jgi:hypothetical protein
MAVAITTDCGSETGMSGGSGDEQQQRNGWQDGNVIAMSNGTVGV